MNLHVIYKLTSPSDKIYIGRTNDFEGRMACHKYYATKEFKRALYKAVRCYGWDNFKKEIIDTAETLDEAVAKELKYIVEFNTVIEGYNCTYGTEHGGDLWDGQRESEKYAIFVSKMSVISTGVNNPMYGKSHTDDTKAKQKDKAKGRFSLPWFIDRNGEVEGTEKYNARNKALSERKMNRNEQGDFIKKTEKNLYFKN